VRILYDGEVYTGQAAGGINRYFGNIISRLPDDFSPTLTTTAIRETNFPSHPRLKTFLYPRHGFRPGRISYWLEKYYFRYVTSFQYDLIHPTYYWLLTRHDLSELRQPIVLTVHDMIHEIFADRIDPNHHIAEEKKKAILSAQALICISENTKRDLLTRYSIPEEKITVIYLASEIDITMSYGEDLVPANPYFLYVGGRLGYKNFTSLLAAFAKVVSKVADLSLCIVGSPLTSTEQKLISDLGLNEFIEHYRYPSDRHLAKLYRCSVAFIYTSLYEGFGIPPLEAMSCGTVAIVAKTSSIPEVVGEAGLYFDPHNANDLVDLMLFILENSAERECLIQKGFDRAKCFSWDKTLAQTIEVYQKLL
jgi:glycosyltransferase involved in cell wall biosynthesis